jgi:hypothetical protein
MAMIATSEAPLQSVIFEARDMPVRLAEHAMVQERQAPEPCRPVELQPDRR